MSALQYVSIRQRSLINSTFKLKLSLQSEIHPHLYLYPYRHLTSLIILLVAPLILLMSVGRVRTCVGRVYVEE